MDPTMYFRQTGVYRFGTMGINSLRGPGYWRVDPAFFKDIQITDRIKSEFRVEGPEPPEPPAVVERLPVNQRGQPDPDAQGNLAMNFPYPRSTDR